MLSKYDLIMALDAISKYHSTKITINAPANGNVGYLSEGKFRLHITECCPSAINALHEANFMLSMTPDGLLIDKL